MPQVTFVMENGKEVTHYAASGSILLEVAKKTNVIIDAPCSGNGTCGKCKVKILEGTLKSEMSRHISIEEYENGYRQACISKITTNVKVLVPEIASSFTDKMKISGLRSLEEIKIFEENITLINNWEVLQVIMCEPTLDDTLPDNERLIREIKKILGNYTIQLPYHVIKTLTDVIRSSSYNVKCIVRKDELSATVYKVMPATENAIPVGMAIDIGTTSVSSLLINLIDGSIMAKASAGNGQIPYGADVIHRIIESTKSDGRKNLQSAIINRTIKPMISNMCNYAGIEEDSVVQICVASNTTMNHLLLGLNAQYIRMEPYIPAFFEIQNIKAENICLNTNPNAEIIVAPNIGSYVGGDITAGVLASMMWNKPELSLFIDLGTNGEIVLGNKDYLMSCACSAGPAFEGGDIRCGIRATDGAIEACTINKDTMEPSLVIIGDEGEKPIGICGSGIIDLISELYRCGIINAKGKFVREGKRIGSDDFGMGYYIVVYKEDTQTGRDIIISEVDIDNFIRAKGAIFSAIKVLIESLDMDISMIEKVYVAGGIGSAINIENAIRLGMIPNIPIGLYQYIGNTSLIGAYGIVTSSDALEKVKEIGKSMTYIELSTNPKYMDEFVAACFIPHTDETLFRDGE